MIGVLLCSGRHTYNEAGALTATCPNPAEVRVANGKHWCRPLCQECAIELAERGEREGFSVAFLELDAGGR